MSGDSNTSSWNLSFHFNSSVYGAEVQLALGKGGPNIPASARELTNC